MLAEILDVIETFLFSPSEPIASLRTIGLVLLLAWLIGRLVSRWFEQDGQGKGGGGGGGKPEKPKPQQPKSGGGGGGGQSGHSPGLLDQLLSGVGEGTGQALRGLGNGIGAALQGLGGGIGAMRGRAGPGPGRTYLGGPQAHNRTTSGNTWKGAAVGLGVGLGLGATAASWAKNRASAAAETARQAWQDWQTARHYSQAPAYSWTVPDDAAETISGAFASSGIPYRWEQAPDGLRVVILQEDVAAAGAALDMAGLEFTELGTPAAIWPEEGTPGSGWIAPDPETGELKEWGPDDMPTDEPATDEPGPVAEVYDPSTGEWVPVADPADGLPADTWGDAGDAGEIVIWGGE